MTSRTIGKLNIFLSICLHNIIPSGTGVESLNSVKDTFFKLFGCPTTNFGQFSIQPH